MLAAPNFFLTGAKVGPVVYKDAAGAASSSVTIPAHNVGDIIVIWASAVSTGQSLTPGKPSASGTVPTWIDIDTPGTNKAYTAYAIATATNTTTGTWTNTNRIIAVVLSGQGSSPIGGHAVLDSDGTSTVKAPAVTLSRTDGTSQILHFANSSGTNTATFNATFSLSGYTARVGGASSTNHRMVTKDSTTSDGQITIGTSSGTGSATWNGSATVEIKAY